LIRPWNRRQPVTRVFGRQRTPRALRRGGQLAGEGGGIADGVVGEEQGPAEAVGDRLQGGLLGGNPHIVPFLETDPHPGHCGTRGTVPGEAFRILEDLQDA
jgi:hypothetical protein